MAGGYTVYARYYPAFDKVQGVMWDSAGARVKEITDSQVLFICTQVAPDSKTVFPYIWVYDIKKAIATDRVPVYLPISKEVIFGGSEDESKLTTVTEVTGDSSHVTVKWGANTDAAPLVDVCSLADEGKIMIQFFGVAVSAGLKVPSATELGDGLVRSVAIEDGVAGTGGSRAKGLTLIVSVPKEKWDALTYNCDLLYGGPNIFRVNLYADKPPTDLTPTVKR